MRAVAQAEVKASLLRPMVRPIDSRVPPMIERDPNLIDEVELGLADAVAAEIDAVRPGHALVRVGAGLEIDGGAGPLGDSGLERTVDTVT